MFHNEYNILAHEFCIGAPILILTNLSNTFNNNICTRGQ